MQFVLFQNPTEWVALLLVLIAGWLFGLASAGGGRKWKRRYAEEQQALAEYRAEVERERRDRDTRLRDLETENARLRGFETDNARVRDLEAENARLRGLEGDTVRLRELEAENARLRSGAPIVSDAPLAGHPRDHGYATDRVVARPDDPLRR